MLMSLSAYSQTNNLSVDKIEQHSIHFHWDDLNKEQVVLKYGLTEKLELGTVSGLVLTELEAATFYYVKASTTSKNTPTETVTQLFTTASSSSGDITVYFNQSVDNNASSIANATQISAFEDTIIAYINSAQSTLDICNYNTGSLPIITAINNLANAGITIRYIAADNTGTNNNELSNLSATIPMLQRPNDGEVMHNKFIIVDAANAALATVLTGSVNHTDNSCHNDYNNMVIIEDQALALAYETEFEEMWGSTGNTPNATNAKFGADKTDNTPHLFNIGGVPVDLYFSPSDGTTAHIETAILSANTEMQFGLLTFINNDLGDAVVSIQNAGVAVKGIIENQFYWGSEYNKLANAGVDVHSHFLEAHSFHHKYGIIDANNTSSDPMVITGSHNWTNSAEDDYDENTLIIHDATIANLYYEEFMARYADITGLVNVNNLNSTESISVYPNPVQDVLNINSVATMEQVILYNSIGQVLFSTAQIQGKEQQLDLRSFPNGVYFVSILTNAQPLSIKLIKNK